MPSVFTLEGPSLGGGLGCKPRPLTLGENAVGRFILAQNPLVAIGLTFGLSAVVGLMLTGVGVGIVHKLRGG